MPIVPRIVDYSLEDPKYILTEEAKGDRLSYILGNNEDMESLEYMKTYGELMAKLHNIKIEAKPVKPRNFKLPHEFYTDNKLEYIERYLLEIEFEDTDCFIHGDCHYANILWSNHKVTCLLDYELSGYGSREYDLAWALVLRPGQKFLKTKEEREVFLESYSRYNSFSRKAFNYYIVLFGAYFYKISSGKENEEYRNTIINMMKEIIY